MKTRCQMPPAGWSCSREPGHDGPCAASPIDIFTGWASPTLGRCYMEIEDLIASLAQPTESSISEALERAKDAIEDADEELMGFSS